VTASGFTDQAGNAVVPFTSNFTTGTSGVANTIKPTVVSVSPANGASAVPVSSPIILTFNEIVDAATLNDINVAISANGAVLSGNYTLDATGTVVTFTPLSPLPGNATARIQVNSSVLDLSGNGSNSFSSTFATGTGSDTTAPVVTMVTPQDGTSSVGTNVLVVLTFSKSLNPSTINTNNFGLVANGNALTTSISTSADNRTVTLNALGTPASTTITVLVTSGVTDLSGNALANFQSQFTTASNALAPTVVSQRPGNGATGVPLYSSVVLYMSEPMNSSSIQGALEVSQNGALVSGATQVTDNGQVIQFTPSSQWLPNALIQVFLTPTAQSVSGLSGNAYQASFTTTTDPNTTAPMLVSTSPANQVTGVPTNVVIDFAFNVPINPAALLADTVSCWQNGVWFQTGVSVLNGGALLQAAPRLPLLPNAQVRCQINTGLQGVNGIPLSYLSANSISFTTAAGPDTVALTALSTSPPSGSGNIGDNADVRLVFNKAINPLTVNASTIQLSGGGVTVVPDSISFSNGNQSALLVPHAPLPDGTQMTLTISGVTDLAGNGLAPQTTQFTTGNGPDADSPLVLAVSPLQNAQNVPLNTIVELTMSEPVDPGTVSNRTLTLLNNCNNQIVAGTYSLSVDGLTVTFVPGALLAANCTYSVNFPGAGGGAGISDLAGNSLPGTSPVTFTTGTTTSVTSPQVLGVSPANAATAVAINAHLDIQFNEPVDGTKLSSVTLSAGSGAVNISRSLTGGNQRLLLIPTSPLAANTAYTLTMAGVQDFGGNVLSPTTTSFTTGATADFNAVTVVSVSPTSNATGVAPGTVNVTFSKSIDPFTVTTGTMTLSPSLTNIPLVGTVTSNGASATFTPSLPLGSLTSYLLQLTGGITDMEGRSINGGFSSSFTTGQGTSPGAPIIGSVVQAAGQVGTPVIINGSYFGTSQNGSTVSFNGVAATPTNWKDTQISVPVPAGATTGPVVVTTNGLASNGFTFTVDATPTITSISPTSGAAGTVVTITGTHLGDAKDSVLVGFGSNWANASSANETSVTAVLPPTLMSGSVTMSVAVNGYSGSGGTFTIIPTPSITGLNPNVAVSTTPITISGNNFGTTQGSSTLTFNGLQPSSVASWSNTSITAVPPSNVTTGPVVVVVNSVPSTSISNVFTVENPAIGSIIPPAAGPGSIISINGSGFQPQVNETVQVFIDGVVASSDQLSSTNVIAQVPSNATSGPVTVVVGGISSNALNFTVTQPPTITSVSPSSGPFNSSGTAVPIIISGAGFGPTQSTSTVNFFGSTTAPVINSWSDSSISLWLPSDAGSGPLYVEVATLDAYAPSPFIVNAVAQITDSLGNQSQYNMNAQGGVWFAMSSQGSGCVSCTMRGNLTSVPDSKGNTLTSTDDLGNITTYTHDTNNNVASISKPLNSTTTATTSYTYNSFGEVLTMTDPLGNVTTNSYDTHGNLLTVTSPRPNGNTAASVTQFQYATNGELTQITDPRSNVTKLTYTTAGLTASITDAQNNVTIYHYDALGNRTAVIDPINGAAHPTTFAYDTMSHLTGITYPDGSTAGFTYDIRGRRITSTDQNNKTTTYTYDDADRLTAITDPANNTTQYNYDTEDNLLSITDANGHTTYFAYNARGWVTQTTFPSTLSESYTYDLVGHIQSKTDRKNQTIQYVYDALYRLTQKTYPDSTNVEYYYDLAGKVSQVSDPTGTYGFTYDNMGRLTGTSMQYAFLPGINYQNAYTYDAASNRTSLTAPDGSISTYGYDTLNRLNGLANTWAGSFGFAYDALSRRTSLTRPNGVNTSYNYDSVSHLLSVLHQVGVNTLDGASYTYDAAGNRTSKTNYLNGVTSDYGYDALYELTQVTQGASTTESYSYDFVGNRLSSSGVPSYSYNASNELTSTSNGSYTYDANGNTLSDPAGKSFTWDFENRLTNAVVPGTATVTFKYDPFGRRVQKSGPLGTTNYIYDRANAIEEIDTGGNVLARYAGTRNLDEQLAEFRSGATSYYQRDGLGSVTSLSSQMGVVANTYAYDSFGKLTSSTGTVTSPFQYTGRELDPETGIYEYRARYYDPSSGRFLTEDPIRFKGGSDFYAYVKNKPVLHTDPSGLVHQAWNEPPYDGRIHNDSDGGLEVMCTKGRNIAQDISWLELSIYVRSEEIDRMGSDADAGHIDRRDAEIDTLARCQDECGKDKKPEPTHDDHFWRDLWLKLSVGIIFE
jgi:RHS repeat-associated protein